MLMPPCCSHLPFAPSIHCAPTCAPCPCPSPFKQVGEVLDYWGDAGAVAWRLTENDVRQVLSQRLDFSSREILALKL